MALLRYDASVGIVACVYVAFVCCVICLQHIDASPSQSLSSSSLSSESFSSQSSFDEELTLSLDHMRTDFMHGATALLRRTRRSGNDRANKTVLLDMLDKAHSSRPDCSSSTSSSLSSSASDYTSSNVKLLQPQMPAEALNDLLLPQIQTTLHVANILNSFFRIRESDDEVFLYSLVKSAVDGDKLFVSCGILFEQPPYDHKATSSSQQQPQQQQQKQSNANTSRSATKGHFAFAPWAYKSVGSKTVYVRDLSQTPVAKYPPKLDELFKERRMADYSSLHWDNKEACKPVAEAQQQDVKARINTSAILTSENEAKWIGPLFDCSFGRTWFIAYMVPFFSCSSEGLHKFK